MRIGIPASIKLLVLESLGLSGVELRVAVAEDGRPVRRLVGDSDS